MKDPKLVDKILTDLETDMIPLTDLRRQARRLRALIFGDKRTKT